MRNQKVSHVQYATAAKRFRKAFLYLKQRGRVDTRLLMSAVNRFPHDHIAVRVAKKLVRMALDAGKRESIIGTNIVDLTNEPDVRVKLLRALDHLAAASLLAKRRTFEAWRKRQKTMRSLR